MGLMSERHPFNYDCHCIACRVGRAVLERDIANLRPIARDRWIEAQEKAVWAARVSS